jgi:hypothetical protein
MGGHGMRKLKYTTRSSGHGSGFVPNEPEKFNMTLEEAISDVDYWRGLACTIGGDAIIVREDGKIIQVGLDKTVDSIYE